jgi:hypothetical protein
MRDIKQDNVDFIDDVKNNEQTVEFDLTVEDFDNSVNELESPEDLDEKTITYIEKQIRNSFEYRGYVQYLKEELDLNTCALLPNIDTKELGISLEFHHFPFNLYDITEIIGTSMTTHLEENQTISTMEIAEKVMAEHYKNNIGLVPLTKTLHKMAHTGSISIPYNTINGNWNNFIKEYKEYISEDKISRIKALEQYNYTKEAKEYNDFKLTKKIAKYNIDYLNKEENDDV